MDEILSYMNDGVLNLKSLKEVNVSRQSIYNFIKRNSMEKVGPGIYIAKDALEDETKLMYYRYVVQKEWFLTMMLCIIMV